MGIRIQVVQQFVSVTPSHRHEQDRVGMGSQKLQVIRTSGVLNLKGFLPFTSFYSKRVVSVFRSYKAVAGEHHLRRPFGIAVKLTLAKLIRTGLGHEPSGLLLDFGLPMAESSLRLLIFRMHNLDLARCMQGVR